MWEKRGAIIIERDFFELGAEAIFTLAEAGDMKNPASRDAFKNLVVGSQVHGDGVHIAAKGDAGKIIPDNDALITQEKGLTLGVFTADCLAIYFYDPATKKIAVAHAGWRGLQKNIIEKVARHFPRPSGVYSAISPHIKKCCYEVNDDVGSEFPGFVQNGFLDITAVATKQLKDCGIRSENISKAEFCTCCYGGFFSWRRERTQKRHLAAIRLL